MVTKTEDKNGIVFTRASFLRVRKLAGKFILQIEDDDKLAIEPCVIRISEDMEEIRELVYQWKELEHSYKYTTKQTLTTFCSIRINH